MLHAETERPVIEAVIEIADPPHESIKQFGALFRKLKKGRYVIRVNWMRKRRTNEQNRAYWFWLGIIAKDTGDDPEHLHQYFKKKFLSKTMQINLTGEDDKIIKTTRTLTTEEFSQYLENIRALIWDVREYWLPDFDPDMALYSQE